MENIMTKLVKLEASPDFSIDHILSKKLLNNFLKGVFKNQQELAKELFISESTITKFCQKLGYNGFREFSERFKIEHEKYLSHKKQILSSESFLNKFLFSVNDMMNNQSFFDSLKKDVLEKEGILIFPSYQSESSALFLRDYLVDQGIDAKCFNPAISGLFVINTEKYLKTNYPILFIFLGPETHFLYRFYEQFKNQKKEIYLITSSGQSDRFLDLPQKFVLTSFIKYSNSYYRRIILELLFLSIFEQEN